MIKSAIAIRIYYGLNCTPMADLLMTDRSVETIQWTDVKQRKLMESSITGYTLIYDERDKIEWSEWFNNEQSV